MLCLAHWSNNEALFCGTASNTWAVDFVSMSICVCVKLSREKSTPMLECGLLLQSGDRASRVGDYNA